MNNQSKTSTPSFVLNFYRSKIKRLSPLGILFIFLFCFISASSKDILVENPGNHNDIQPNLQAAVDKAVNGDVVILPEGEFILNKGVIIKKFISLKGQGLSKTILYRSKALIDSLMRGKDWRTMIVYDIGSDDSSGIVVSGICFRGKKPSVTPGDGGSIVESNGLMMIQCVDFLIEYCRFEYFRSAGIEVRHKDSLARGLIRKNEFYYNAGFGLGYGVVVYGASKTWIQDPHFGSSNFIFVEDNTFDYHRHSIAAGGCALFVFRHNTVLNNIAASGGHAIDTHEARPGEGSKYGTRAVEVYDNNLVNTTYTYRDPIVKGEETRLASLEESGIAIRNGEAVVYNNSVKGYRYAVSLSNWYFGGTTQPYPVLYGPGYLSGKEFGPNHTGDHAPYSNGDVFIWNNRVDPFLSGTWNSYAPFHNEEPVWWKDGRDYHLEPKPDYKPYPYPYPVKENKSEN